MEIYMMENEVMIKQTDKEFITIAMEPNTKEIERMIFRMDLALKHGTIIHAMRETIVWDKSMAKEPICEMMAPNMRALGKIIK